MTDARFWEFTDDARRCVVEAQVLARGRGGAAQPEHLLLALAARRGGAGEVLKSLGCSLDALQRRVDTLEVATDSTHLTGKTELVLDRAQLEADVHGHAFVRTGHVLLAMLGHAPASALLKEQGLPDEVMRERLSELLQGDPLRIPS